MTETNTYKASWGSLDASCNKNSKDEKQYCLCNQGERVVRFASKHYNKEEDRVWDLGCKPINPELTIPGDWVISWTEKHELNEDQLWNGVDSNSFLVGMESEHDNGAEDRAFTFFTARSDNFALKQCSAWKKLNDFDEEIDLQLGDEEVIAAITSVHKKKKGDREFSVITCKIARKTGETSETSETGELLFSYNEITFEYQCFIIDGCFVFRKPAVTSL